MSERVPKPIVLKGPCVNPTQFCALPGTVNKLPFLGFAARSMLFVSWSYDLKKDFTGMMTVNLAPYVAQCVMGANGQFVPVDNFRPVVEWPSLEGLEEARDA